MNFLTFACIRLVLLYVWSDLIPVEGDAVAAVDSQPPFLNHSRTLSPTHQTHSRNHSPFLPNFLNASPGELIWIFLRLQFDRFLEQAASRAACSPRLPALPSFSPTFVVLGPVPNRITDIFSPAAAAAAAATSPSPSSGAARVLSLHSAVFDKCGGIE